MPNRRSIDHSSGGDIFQLDRLIVPINIKDRHWLLVCVFMKDKSIRVYDSLPFTILKDGGSSYIQHIWTYLQDEYKDKKGDCLPDQDRWNFYPCLKGDTSAVIQGQGSNDCGVYSCMFMDLLMNRMDPSLLRSSVVNVTQNGRKVLWRAIRNKLPIFKVTLQGLQEGDTRFAISGSKETVNLTSVNQKDKGIPVDSPSKRKRKKRKNNGKKQRHGGSDYLHLFGNGSTPYIEELEYHFYNSEDNKTEFPLKPLPPAWEFELRAPKLNDSVEWSYDPKQRVVLANFSQEKLIHSRHKEYLGQLLERDDITVISQGLVEPVKDLTLFLNALKWSHGESNPYHNFRQYNRILKDGYYTYVERKDAHVTMKMSDYLNYLTIRTTKSMESSFTYENSNGMVEIIEDATTVVFYLLDLDLSQHFVALDSEFKESFKMKEMLPAGAWCMLHDVSKKSLCYAYYAYQWM